MLPGTDPTITLTEATSACQEDKNKREKICSERNFRLMMLVCSWFC